MCDASYHHEALRKARVLQRKQEALARLGVSDRQAYEVQPKSPAKTADAGTFDLRREVRVEQGTGYDNINYPPSARHGSSHVQHGIYKDLKGQEKTLRDHNLVMGPMSAFGEYFEPRGNNKGSYSYY